MIKIRKFGQKFKVYRINIDAANGYRLYYLQRKMRFCLFFRLLQSRAKEWLLKTRAALRGAMRTKIFSDTILSCQLVLFPVCSPSPPPSSAHSTLLQPSFFFFFRSRPVNGKGSKHALYFFSLFFLLEISNPRLKFASHFTGKHRAYVSWLSSD